MNAIGKLKAEASRAEASVYDITTDMFDALNKRKGYDVSMTLPKTGELDVKFNGSEYRVKIDYVGPVNDEPAEVLGAPLV